MYQPEDNLRKGLKKSNISALIGSALLGISPSQFYSKLNGYSRLFPEERIKLEQVIKNGVPQNITNM